MQGCCEPGALKQTGWSSSITELNHQIEQLKERIGVLASRLEPLFCPEQMTNNKTPGEPTPPKAQAILEIDSASYRIKELREIINEMTQRLEI